MFKYIVVLALMVPAIFATTGIKDCRNKAPQPKSVEVANCDSTPCTVYLDSKAQMQLIFEAPFEVTAFSPDVQAGVLGMYIPYALPEDMAIGCDHLESSRCPLQEGEFGIYNFEFPVGASYPTITVDIELSLKSGDEVITCAGIQIAVKSQ